MNHCKTCKHWSPLPDAPPDGFGGRWYDDDSDEGGSGCGVPWQPKSGFCRKAQLPVDEDNPFVQDGSGYRACLVTREYFGCVLHEVKT